MSRGPSPFQRRAAAAVRDQALRAALLEATDRLAGGRDRAMGALPHAERLRDHARRIRAHTIASLDRYLSQFADRATRAGARVFWAGTAEEATRYVTDLARARHVRSAVKSKSMVTEEIELNRALEASGVRVLETDLGEFIVQLAADRPSHIIVPVIHRTADDVAGLFRRTLGATADDVGSIAAMTAFARRKLRAEFLNADMGISGANFAVAETGTICLVTNEGNGRLTTTVPPLHVAVVGIERVVPTVNDLGVLLQLLARSATGQPLSVYTSLITGPRRHGDGAGAGSPADERDRNARRTLEPDGPDELHIVLVDNGRSGILGSELAEILYCIRCGACLNTCPVYRSIGGHAYGGVYPGPVGSVFAPALEGLAGREDLPHASSLCGACRDACPVRIDIPGLLLKLRADPRSIDAAPWWLRAGVKWYARVATRPRLFGAAGRLAAGVTRLAARGGWIARLPGPLGAWTDSRDFPALARRRFTDLWNDRRPRT